VNEADDANSCSDLDFCTLADHCSAGSCVGTAVDCGDGDVCTSDSCDPATGACAHVNSTNACDDGSACTTGDQCGPSFWEDFDGMTLPALPAGWSTVIVTGAAGDGAFETVETLSDTAPNAVWTEDPAHRTDKILNSPAIAVATATAQLEFRHQYDLEEDSDGAVLEIAVGGGAFVDVVAAGGTFAAGGYNGTISAADGSPIAGREAWTGASAGFVTATVNLPASAAGQSVVLRWRVASDDVIGRAGYWVDSIAVTDPGGRFTCSGAAVVCDDSNACTVDSCDPALGCVSAPGNAGAECRPPSGEACDPAEFCDGVSATCPPDAFGESVAVGNTVQVSNAAPTQVATISWDAEVAPGPFNVYRGNWPSAGPLSYTHACLVSGLAGTSATDMGVLSPGEISYYLVSRRNAPCLESSLGLNTAGAERPNSSPCP
jgi:hypothetical protein